MCEPAPLCGVMIVVWLAVALLASSSLAFASSPTAARLHAVHYPCPARNRSWVALPNVTALGDGCVLVVRNDTARATTCPTHEASVSFQLYAIPTDAVDYRNIFFLRDSWGLFVRGGHFKVV